MKKYKRVYIEITNICNLDCSFCPKTKREKRYMSIEEYEYILTQIKGLTDYIYLHIMGEPTLHKYLKEFLNLAGKYNLKVNLTTNGTLLKEKNISHILLNSSALHKISISLHSFEANNTMFTLSEYLKSIVKFTKKASNSKNIITALRLWNLDSEGIKGDNTLNNTIIEMLEKEFEKEIVLSDIKLIKNDFKLADKTYIQFAGKFEWPDITKDITQNEVFCYGLRNQFGILVDGTVVPCCLDNDGQINLGNIFKTDIKDILNSKRAKNIYDGFSNRKSIEKLCKKCQYAQRF